MIQNHLLEKLLSQKPLSRSEKDRLRDVFPTEKFESLILQLSQNKKNRPTMKQLYRAQNVLYPKKKPKKFRVVPTVGRNVVGKVVSGGLPSLGRKR